MKKKLKTVGFYKELEYGSENCPSIYNSISSNSYDYEKNIINYLESGVILYSSIGISYDVIKKDKIIGSGPCILTDGKWAWPDDLIYYVRNYHIILPNEFIEYMRNNLWKISNKENINIDNLYLKY